MKERHFILLFFIMFIGFYLFLMYKGDVANTYMHEQVHLIINQKYDIESNITVNSFTERFKDGLAGYTMPLNNTEYLEKCNETCRQMHIYNEIVTYNNQQLVFTIFIVGLFVIILFYFLMMRLAR